MTTGAPASLPERLADAEGELSRAVNAAILAECDSPRICSVNGRVKEGIRCGPCERKALFTILARLAAAESAREALKAEIRDQAMKQLASDAGWELENDKLRAERDEARAELHEALHGEEAEGVLQGLKIMVGARDAAEAALSAALARAERAEKALVDVEQTIIGAGHVQQGDPAHEAIRAALAHPVTAEEN